MYNASKICVFSRSIFGLDDIPLILWRFGMKRFTVKITLLSAMLVIVLAFGLAFVGCDDGSTGGGDWGSPYTPTAPSAPTGVTATPLTA